MVLVAHQQLIVGLELVVPEQLLERLPVVVVVAKVVVADEADTVDNAPVVLFVVSHVLSLDVLGAVVHALFGLFVLLIFFGVLVAVAAAESVTVAVAVSYDEK